MAATVSGSKTVTMDVNPTHTAAKLTSIFATAPENLTVGSLKFVYNCLLCKAEGENESLLIGSFFN